MKTSLIRGLFALVALCGMNQVAIAGGLGEITEEALSGPEASTSFIDSHGSKFDRFSGKHHTNYPRYIPEGSVELSFEARRNIAPHDVEFTAMVSVDGEDLN